jgi:hypothetical protein
MSAALLSVARRGATDDPILAGIFKAQNVNTALGGQFVTPWDVGQLPQEWIEACMAVNNKLPEIKSGMKEMNDFLAKWKSENLKWH